MQKNQVTWQSYWTTILGYIFCVFSMLYGSGAYANGASSEKIASTGLKLQSVQAMPLRNGDVDVTLHFSGPLSQEPRSFNTEQPPRIILDFIGVTSAMQDAHKMIAVGVVQSYSVVNNNDRTRVMLDLKEAATYKVSVEGNCVRVHLHGRSPVSAYVKEEQFAANPWTKKTAHAIKSVDFHRDPGGGGRVVVNLSDPNISVNVVQEGKKIVVDFVDTELPTPLSRKLEVTDFATPVQTITTKRKGANTEMVIAVLGEYQQLAYQVNNQFIVDVSAANQQDMVGAEEAVRYTGERLSLNFQDISIRAVLQLLAEFTGINIVASDSVQGNITLRLNNVPWDEALAIILKTQGLAQRKVGNVMMIAPATEVAAHEKQELEAKNDVRALAPLITDLVQLNYAKAADMAGLLKDKSVSLLSPRGNVTVDTRTNTLLIQDTSAVLGNVRDLIGRLDVPVRQVLIEARLVNVDTNYEKDLGIRFGVTDPTHVSGTIQGANEINNNAMSDPGTNPLIDVNVIERLNVNLPATPTSGLQPATIGVALAKLGKDFLVDLEISALESEGAAELVSSPRLVTANQQEAYIEQGQEIPYQESTSSGATAVEFKKAVLGLRVTPQITPDGRIIMDLKINQDRRAPASQDVDGVPAINTQQLETLVLVDNGQTIVLGGVYTEDRENTVVRVPFLGSLPVVGVLFKQTQKINNRTELLIFITPKIIEQTSVI